MPWVYATVSLVLTGPSDWRDRSGAFRGSIHGLSNAHNILEGGYRPMNVTRGVVGLHHVGGGVQPGPGLPMVVQSGKIAAARVARDVRLPLGRINHRISAR